MEISDAVGIRIREDNKGNNKEDMDSKNLFFFKVYATIYTQEVYYDCIAQIKKVSGKGHKNPLTDSGSIFLHILAGCISR